MVDTPEKSTVGPFASAGNLLDGRITDTDSKHEPDHLFEAIHCGPIYRYSEKVFHSLPMTVAPLIRCQVTKENMPEGISDPRPTHLVKENGHAVDYRTLQPRVFKEVWKSAPFYLHLHRDFESLFDWIVRRVSGDILSQGSCHLTRFSRSNGCFQKAMNSCPAPPTSLLIATIWPEAFWEDLW